MKVTYTLETAWPNDRPNPNHYDVCEWGRHGQIPFVPAIGLLIDCGEGDYRQIEQVFWNAAEPDEITVHFEDEQFDRTASFMLASGWTTDNFDPEP